MTVRAFYGAAKVPGAAAPYDTLTFKLYYPAKAVGSEMERMSGVVPADKGLAPFPVVILLPGINVGPESYGWLAQKLVDHGLVVVTYGWISEDLPGFVNLTPGVDINAVKAGQYGSAPTCPAVRVLLNELKRLQEKSLLKGLLALDKVILGGHSAGGTMALQSVHEVWHPEVKGVFGYGAHLMAATMLGYEAGTILPMLGNRPVLLLGGSKDGVIAASSQRYNIGESATIALERTFSESIQGGDDDSFLIILDGANHFTMAWPRDETTGRAFLEVQPGPNDGELRALMGELIANFIDGYVRKQPEAQAALGNQIEDNPYITMSRVK